ncbi:Two-component response regulator [Acaryochloris thomasi RCC1774]|uniref:Two-component response regulator n=1 Tax=Acaryochloris thomasi RCC1774 TaxID=1764569 RepID=A0A2W1JQ34_9CYAN|nr:response regulator [Acaryochloris thomasi]PZD73525.1 Two-component response regulator [Acaryochloris thomasi RCC1774]
MTAPAPASPVVLIIDDDRSTRGLLNLAMSTEGYQVVEAKDGEQGLAEYRISQPNLVLMDAVMPGMDGFNCCQRLRQLPGGDRVPLLILTVLDDQASVDQAFAVGATDYITKPINWPVLSERVRRLLATHQALITAEATCSKLEGWTQCLSQSLHNHDQELWEQLQQLVNALQSVTLTHRIHLWQQQTSRWVESAALPSLENPSNFDLALQPDWQHRLQQGEILALDQLSLTKDPAPPALWDNLQALQTRALVVVPILAEQQLWGTLYLHSPQPDPNWSDTTLERLADLQIILKLILAQQQ